MAETARIKDSADEYDVLRARIAELERQLGKYESARGPNVAEASNLDRVEDDRVSTAERAIEGFFDQSLVMMIIADLVEARFLRINNAVCEVLGLSEREILESSFLDRVHPDDIPKTIREMGRLTAGKRTTGFQNRHLRADGTYRVFRWAAVADEDRELCYAMAIDVTGQDT